MTPASRSAQSVLWVLLGAASLASGIALILWPAGMAVVYELPAQYGVAGLIGARDVVIGLGLLRAVRSPRFMWARCVSDACDAVLIASDGVHTGRYWAAALRDTVALLVCVVAFRLARDATTRKS